MDPSFDDFIHFNNDFNFKPSGGLFDNDFALSSPFSEDPSEAKSLIPTFLPKTIQNLLDPEEEPIGREHLVSQAYSNSQQPYGLVKTKKEATYTASSDKSDFMESVDTSDFYNSPDRSEFGINSKSKKIQKTKPKGGKGEKKNKQSRKSAIEALLKNVDSKYIPEGFDDPDLDDKTRKKMIQMIRNRVSAQTSRDKKKAYLNQVEEVKDKLAQEREMLAQEKAQLLDRIKKLEEEVGILRSSAGPLCSKCGCTLEFESPSTNNETEEGSLLGRSNPPSPLRRGASRRGVFGFSMAFAVVLCVFLFMNGGSLGGFTPQGGKLKRMKPTMQFVSRVLENDLGVSGWMQTEKSDYTDENEVKESDMEILDKFEKSFKGLEGLEVEQFEILNNIKPLMDQFDSLHQNIYKNHEKKSHVIDLPASNNASLKFAPNNHTFLGKEPVMKTKNRTTTLFCPTGFEFYRKPSSMEVEDAKVNRDSTLAKRQTLDLGKAEYIQLLLPKYSVGHNDIENLNGTNNLPAYQKFDEEGSLIEVWCKIFAVRDLSNIAQQATF